MVERYIVVGDIHGCIEEFNELLAAVSYRQNRDQLVLLGDLVDRGPDPVGVVRRARELGALSVLGNHEEKHLRYRRHEKKRALDPQYKNPMRPMDGERLAQHRAFSEEDWAWIEALPITLDFAPGWLAVHAGFEPALPLDKQRADKMLRVRYVDVEGKMRPIKNDTDQPEGTWRWAQRCEFPVHIAYGHHALSKERPAWDWYAPDSPLSDSPFLMRARVALDTACVFGGALSALVLDEQGHFFRDGTGCFSVPARATYATVWHGDE